MLEQTIAQQGDLIGRLVAVAENQLHDIQAQRAENTRTADAVNAQTKAQQKISACKHIPHFDGTFKALFLSWLDAVEGLAAHSHLSLWEIAEETSGGKVRLMIQGAAKDCTWEDMVGELRHKYSLLTTPFHCSEALDKLRLCPHKSVVDFN